MEQIQNKARRKVSPTTRPNRGAQRQDGGGRTAASLVSIRDQIEALRRPSGKAEPLSHQLAEYVLQQVGMLQEVVLTLADAVVVEIGELKTSNALWQSERGGWLTTMRQLQQSANDKWLSVERHQAQSEAELAAAKKDMQVTLSRQMAELDKRSREAGRHLLAAQTDVQLMRNQLGELELLSSSDFPPALLLQRHALVNDAVKEAARVVAPGALAAAAPAVLPGLVRDEMGGFMGQVGEDHARAVCLELGSEVQGLNATVASVAAEVSQLSSALADLHSQWPFGPVASDALRSVSPPPVARSSTPRPTTTATASDRVPAHGVSRDGGPTATSAPAPAPGLRTTSTCAPERTSPSAPAVATAVAAATSSTAMDALHDRLESMARQQGRYARSMEEVVKALVNDAAGLAKQGRRHEVVLAQHRHHLHDLREALLKSVQVFSQQLHIPPPVLPTSLAPLPSPPPSHSPASSMTASSAWTTPVAMSTYG